jgi:eukaryotic-like serine/threonine-protein kinase
MTDAKIEMLGRYKVLGVIGRGAMGVVYRAVDPAIDRVVAIKTIDLSLDSEDRDEFEARFQQEVKAAGRFSHPNVVTIYDVGRTEEVSYMAMEYLNGKELKEYLSSGQCPGVELTVELMLQVANGLAYAHDHGVIHRDIKPSNIMVINMPNGVLAKITDFGIARMPGAAVRTLTGVVMGSPKYMSPEQVIGKKIDHRSDIFSLGVVMYETLTGVAPFEGTDMNSIMFATCNANPRPPSALMPSIPPMLDFIVAKALAKNLEDRYQTMTELASDLRELSRQLLGATGKRPALFMPAVPASPAQPGAATLTGTFQPDSAESESFGPLKVSSQFDSLSATMRLAAMGKQSEEFADYLSETQKLRVLDAKQAASSAPAAEQPAPRAAPNFVPIPRAAEPANRGIARDEDESVPLLPAMVLGSLTLTAIALSVALVVR